MITSLLIKDFILIDELSLEFSKGFNVITGETGAGKSIIIQAIDLAFGSRASKEIIKTGKNKALIELSIRPDSGFPKQILEDKGIDFYDNELVFSREISENSSRSRVNGVLVTQDVIKELRELLIDIHSQHMTYTYIQPKYHINLLDNFGSQEHLQLLNSYKNLYSNYCDIEKKLSTAKEKSDYSEQQIDFLKFQIDEIETAQIENISEDIELAEELNILANSEKLKELTYSSYWGLYGDEPNIISMLGKIKSNISKAVEFDAKLQEYETDIVSCQETLKELASSIRDYSENHELDEQRLNEIQARIDVLDKIKRKYGSTLEQVQETYENLSKEYNSIENSQDEIIALENEKEKLKSAINAASVVLTDSRKEIANGLSRVLTAELEKLDMPKVKFEVSVEACEFNTNGADNVEFLISTNISEEPKPLAKIASGGEISRVMLAMKTIFADTDNIGTVVFDEIDTGISGKACQAVADEISELSKRRQIISITHQPIIAAKSDTHLYVTKSQNETTQVKVYKLDENNKINAIAMLAAGEVNDDSVKFAKQLIYG